MIMVRTNAYDRAVENEQRVKEDARNVRLDEVLKSAKKIENYLVNGIVPE